MPLADDIIDRYDEAKGVRAQYEDTLFELGRYVWPKMQDIVHTEKDDNDNRVRTVDIYDGTAILASKRMTTGIVGNLMPIGTRMFDFAAEDDDLNEDTTVKAQLSRATSMVHKVLWRSNFIGQVTNLIRSMVVFTLGAISMQVVKDKRVFKSYHIRDIFFERNYLNEMDTVFRRIFYTARQAQQAWGDDLGKSVVKDLNEAKNKSKVHEFVHAVIPNKDFDGKKVGSGEWVSLIINIKDKHIVEQKGSKSLIYRIVQFGENLDGDMGDGPSTDLLPEIKMVNAMRCTMIVSSEKVADPPMMVEDDGVVGQPVTSGGGLIVIRSGAQFPQPWNSGARLDITDAMIKDSQQTIREGYLNDVFDAMKFYRRETRAELKEAEIVSRIEEGFVALFPLVKGVQRDLLDPMILEILDSLDIDLKFDKKIVYQGRLALAMSAMEANAIETFIAKQFDLDQIHHTLDNIDMDKAARITALETGVPAGVLRDEDDVVEIRKERNALPQAQAEATIAADAAKAFKDVASV